ncbi:cytochrome P450 [Actinomycetospora sp. TBRC 11914]|uniref:cytochrome P450 n=1 Tax=Actinomycetospora sp. TBRC 11914 TaxID=2729387 RepID=UPI00145D4363|nr:cytochrome P450 [Actinomycetospora sp. TBRC 11914]NMO92910.1 cytochrome P450 [Actinomycetospora sp. TBRC 11914]
MSDTTTELAPADHAAPDTADEPALLAWLARMRDESPVWRDRFGMYHLFRHADVHAALRDPATFSSDTGRLAPATRKVNRGMLTQLDPPEHRRMRAVVSSAFTPKRVAALEPRIRAITHSLLDDLAESARRSGAGPSDREAGAAEEFDLVDALAFPLPVTVIAEMLGLPASDHATFRGWADRLFSMQVDDPTDPELGPRVDAAMADIRAYLVAAVQERRAAVADGTAGDDLITALVAAEVVTDGSPVTLDDEEAANFSLLLLLAGHITTTVLLGNAVRTFADHPLPDGRDPWTVLAEDPTTIPAALEEVLRLRSPFTQTGRVTTRPVEVAGVTIPADRFVLPSLLSANHDERAFADPEAFVLDRGIGRPGHGACGAATGGAAQTAFGHGVHFCLGAPLARLEGRVALEELTARYAALAPAAHTADALRPYPRGVLGVRNLPVRGTPRHQG